MQEDEATLDAKWRTVQEALGKRLEPLGLRMNHDWWLHLNVKAQPYYALVEIHERSQLTVGLLLACNEALASVEHHLGLMVGMFDAQGAPSPLVELSGGGFTVIPSDLEVQKIVGEAYRQIGMIVE